MIKKRDPAVELQRLESEARTLLSAHPGATEDEKAYFEYGFYARAWEVARAEGDEILTSALKRKRDDAERRLTHDGEADFVPG